MIYTDISYDLNIIKNHSDILITSRATSTLGWCLASGKPVISIGKYDKFVKNDFTGLLLSQFSVSQITNWLINYKDNKYIHINYEKNALEIIKKYCNPKKNSAAMESFFINCL